MTFSFYCFLRLLTCTVNMKPAQKGLSTPALGISRLHLRSPSAKQRGALKAQEKRKRFGACVTVGDTSAFGDTVTFIRLLMHLISLRLRRRKPAVQEDSVALSKTREAQQFSCAEGASASASFLTRLSS